MFFLIIACSQTEKTSDSFNASPHTYEANLLEASDVDLDAMALGLETVLSEFHSLNAQPVLTAYDSLMAQADDYCPSFYEVDGNAFWYADCTTDSGAIFDGYSFYNEDFQTDSLGNGGIYDSSSLNGAASYRLDGNLVHWGGYAMMGQGIGPDGNTVHYSNIGGSFYSAEDQVKWMQSGRSLSLLQYHVEVETQVGMLHGLYFQGDIPIDNSEITAISFPGNGIYDERLGYPCETEPVGPIRVRDAQGLWIEVIFDVAEGWELVGECDGCGSAYLDGDLLGDFCVDMSSLIDWNGSPW